MVSIGVFVALASLVQAGAPVHFVADEADAVLAILRERRTGAAPSPADWAALFASAGYRALLRRMGAH